MVRAENSYADWKLGFRVESRRRRDRKPLGAMNFGPVARPNFVGELARFICRPPEVPNPFSSASIRSGEVDARLCNRPGLSGSPD
jgi:hypothetical protein